MLAAEPQVASAGYWVLGKWRRGIGSLLVRNGQQAVDLARIEAGKREIVIGLVQLLEFQG
jgi:CRISPR/Cas system CMR-associated protein Cmr1 (group 7 of RAMP superfamily)